MRLLGVLLGVFCIGIAQAQNSDSQPAPAAPSSEEETVLPTVTVSATAEPSGVTEGSGSYTTDSASTATRLNLSPRETPQSMTVITRQRIEDQNLTSFNDVIDQTVGISRQQYGDRDAGYVFYYARGFRINNYQLDGVITAPGSMEGFTGIGTRDTAVYDHITVVRGATGLLTGAGDPSASINLVRKRPTPEFQAHVATHAGRWNRYRAEADISGPLDAEGRLRGRFVAAHEDNESWMVRANSRKSTFYAVLETDLSPATVLRGGVEYFSLRARQTSPHGFNYTDTAGARTHWTGFDNPHTRSSYSNLDRTILFADLEHRLDNGWQARLSANHTRVDADQLYGVAAQDVQAGTNASRVTIGKAVNTPHQNAVDGSLSGSYTLFGREHEAVLGFNYYRLSRNDPAYDRQLPVLGSIYDFDGSTPNAPFVSSGRDPQETRQSGVYAATRLKPTDALSVIVGSRVSSYKNKTNWADQNESNVLTPYVGVVVDVTPQWSAYASYTTIFNPQSAVDVSGKTLDPEEGKNFELGLKGELLGGRLNVSAAVFQTRKDNLAVRDGNNLTPNGDYAYRAENDTTSKGWELEVGGELLPGWQIAGGFTHVITRDSADARLNTAAVPENQLKLFTSYRLRGGLQGLTIGGGVTWQSKVYETNSSYNAARLAQYQQKSYAVVNLLARYELTRHLDLTLNLENAFDKRYRTNVSQHNIGAPRNFMLTARYQF